MNVLITGADGRIGKRLIPALALRGHEVVAVSRRGSDFGSDVLTVQGDLTQSEVRDQAFAALSGRRQGARVVLHLAAFNGSAGEERAHPSAFFANVELAHLVMESAVAAGVDRFLYASTGLVYGTRNKAPCDESDAPDPPSYYAATKLAAEVLVRARTREAGMQSDILRLGNVFGPESLESTVAGRIFGQIRRREPISIASPGSIRDFIFVADAVAAMVALLESGPAGAGAVVNIGSGVGVSVRDLADAAAKAAGVDGPGNFSQCESRDVLILSPARMSARTGWKPRYSLDQAVRECVLPG